MTGELLLIINMKAYHTAFGEVAYELARAAARLESRLSKARILLAPPSPLALELAKIHEGIILQHVDPIGYGAHTGYIPAQALEKLPVAGTLVNHSEHKLPYRDVAAVVEAAKKAGKIVIACADTPGEAAGLAYLGPTAIAVEPPELIGTGIPVSKAKPEVITGAVKAVESIDPSIPVLAGAGISGPEDVVAAVKLGARGVLVASAVMKAPDPAGVMEKLALALEGG